MSARLALKTYWLGPNPLGWAMQIAGPLARYQKWGADCRDAPILTGHFYCVEQLDPVSSRPMHSERLNTEPTPPTVSTGNRSKRIVLLVAFLGWLFAGVQMSITPLVSQSATQDFLRHDQEPTPRVVVTTWFARYNATFLFGAAAGGAIFGWCGDRWGRAKALGASICCYSLFSFLAIFAATPEQFIVMRFLGCLGIGGTWPNAIALAGETWSAVSRPVLAGVIGTAANVGIVLMGLIACYAKITPDHWRWVMVLGSTSIPIGLYAWRYLPESPKWLESRTQSQKQLASPLREILAPPLLFPTLIGIVLGAIPLFGGWGCTNWLVPWADHVGAKTDPSLKAWTQVYRSVGASLSSLAGGWLSARIGMRTSYVLYSLSSLCIGQYIYRSLDPLHPQFGFWVFMLGTTSGFYFGWLPLCLPEFFPTHVRSTGAGVTFNTGRILTGLGVLGAGYLSSLAFFGGDYAKIGSITSLVFGLGIVFVWFAPRIGLDSANATKRVPQAAEKA